MLHVLRCATACKRHVGGDQRRILSVTQSRLPFDIAFAGNHGLEIAGGGLDFEHPRLGSFDSAMPRVHEALRRRHGRGRGRGSRTKACPPPCTSVRWTLAMITRCSFRCQTLPSQPSAPNWPFELAKELSKYAPRFNGIKEMRCSTC